MKKYIFSAIIMIMMANCGGGSTTTTEDNTSTNSDTTTQTPDQYPSSNETIEDNETNQTISVTTPEVIDINDTTTPITSSAVISQAINQAGYRFEFLTLASLRGSVDYQTYLYLTTKEATVALLGAYVYALENAKGQRILFTIDGPKDFDALEKSSELVLRANFASTLRYSLNFAPTGYVNLNTTRTNPNATIETLFNELRYAFSQFTLSNPSFKLNALEYKADPKGDSTSIFCNETKIPLDVTQNIVDLTPYFSTTTEMIHCKTQNAVLIGTISASATTSTISGDLYKTITPSSPQVEGLLYVNKENVEFVANEMNGQYGTFAINSSGQWIYNVNISTPTNSIDLTQPIKESFGVETTDGAAATVVISLSDTTLDVGDITEGMEYIKGAIFSADSTQSVTAQTLRGNYGKLDLLADGTWKYLLDNNLSVVKALNHGDTLIDTFAITSDIDVEITILGQNSVILGTVYAEVIEAVRNNIGGLVHIEYSDNATLKPDTLSGNYGTFTITATGEWNYQLSPLLESVIKLTSQDQLEERFTIYSTDGANNEIRVGVIGADSLIKGDIAGSMLKTDISIDGKLSIERGINEFIAQQKDGLYGFFNLDNTGAWYYMLDHNNPEIQALDANNILAEYFAFSAVDGTTKEIKISISATNIPLTILNKTDFDTLPTLVESPNNQDAAIDFKILQVEGDDPQVTYKLNGQIIDVNSTVMLKGGQDNTIEVLIEELKGDKERLSLSKVIKVADTLPPQPPFVDHETSTTQNVSPVLVTAYEDNVSIYVNGVFVDTIVDSTKQQSVALDTSGDPGLKIFDFTLKDAQGNESGPVKVEIQKLSADPFPTDFSAVHILNSDGNGALAGNISDLDGIAKVDIYYDGTLEGSYTGSGQAFSLTESYVVYGTTFEIKVTDNLGNLKISSGTIIEQDDPTDFSDLNLTLTAIEGTIAGYIKDTNGLDTIKIFYDGTLTSTIPASGATTYYIYESYIEYNTTVSFEVNDTLGNIQEHVIEVTEPTHFPTNFSNVLIGDNNETTGFLHGGVSDQNGISGIDVYYNGTWDQYISGDGLQNVPLDAANFLPQLIGTTYKLIVYDMIGDSADHNGTIAL